MKTRASRRWCSVVVCLASVVACSEPTVPAPQPEVTASAAFQRALSNPKSFGRLHNAGLDSVLRRVKKARTGRGGRKLTKAEMCDVIAGYAIDKGNDFTRHVATLASSARSQTAKDLIGCDVASRIHAAGPTLSLTATRTVTEDWIDTLFATPSEWDEADGFSPSVPEDDATVAVLDNVLTAALANSSSLSQAQSSIAAIVSSMDTASAGTAEIIGEMAGLAVSSVEYWNENIDDWVEQFCEESPPENGPSHSRASYVLIEACDNPQTPSAQYRARANFDGSIPWSTIAAVGVADVAGALGPIGLLYDAYRELAPSYKKMVGVWKEIDVGLVKAAVREEVEVGTNVSMKAVVKQLGAKAGRRFFFGAGVVGAVASSAIAVL